MRAYRWVGLAAVVSLLASYGCSSRDEPPATGCVPGVPCDDAGSVEDAGDGSMSPDADPPDAAEDAAEDGAADAMMDAEVDAGPLTGDSYLFVADILDVGAPIPGGDPDIVPGFDIDGRVSDATDREGCRKPDVTSPAPDGIEGVDNELGPVLAETEAMFGIRANLAEALRTGQLLVLFDVRGVDDFENDDRVEVDTLFGVLPAGVALPMRDGGSRYLPGQTFDIDTRSLMADGMTAAVTLPGRIVDGRLQAGPGEVSLVIPFMDMVISLDIQDVQLRFDVSAERISTGVLGGGLDVDATVTSLAGAGFDDSLTRLVLNGAADLRPDSRFICQSVSIGLVFHGVPAVRGVTVTP